MFDHMFRILVVRSFLDADVAYIFLAFEAVVFVLYTVILA